MTELSTAKRLADIQENYVVFPGSLGLDDIGFLLGLIDGYEKMWEATSKRLFPGEVDSGDALVQVFKEKDALIERQKRALARYC